MAELALMAAVTLAAAWLAPLLPARLPMGSTALVAASILLAQGLVRDLWLLWRSRQDARAPDTRAQRCLCVESGFGVLVIGLGLVLLLGGIGGRVTLGRVGWTILVFAALGLGFALKDLIFEWNPWRLRREKDHANIIFTWRRKHGR